MNWRRVCGRAQRPRGSGSAPAACAAVVALASFLALASLAGADTWPAARAVSVFSDDGRHFVRVIPGKSVGESVGFSGAPKGDPARGEFYVKEADRSYRLASDVPLVHPVAPVSVVVSNTGYVIMLDNWHNMGHGAAAAVYDPSGALVKAWRLEDLYDARQLAKIPSSVSSRWWRCRPTGFVDPDTQTQVYVPERLGGYFVFTLATATLKYNVGRAPCHPAPGPFSATFLP